MAMGLHVPEMLLFDVAGRSADAVEFWHSGAICAKAGVTPGLTVMLIVAFVAHCPALGAKV